ncbi:BlaI/MecI/CopY family transcriptional regulator [bacterium]|nr:BlaI/MecI/CopY family transcriptional regulator [bacterium]
MSKFTDGELDVMRILWEHGELKPADIIARFPRPIKNPAMRSFLSVLLRKGHVTRSKVGKAYFYKAVTQEDPAFSSMLRKMVDVFFSGSTEALLLRLIKSEKLTGEQLLELKKLAQQEDKKGAGK